MVLVVVFAFAGKCIHILWVNEMEARYGAPPTPQTDEIRNRFMHPTTAQSADDLSSSSRGAAGTSHTA